MKVISIILLVALMSSCTYSKFEQMIDDGNHRLAEISRELAIKPKFGIKDFRKESDGFSFEYIIYGPELNHLVVLYYNSRGNFTERHIMVQ